MKLGAIALDRQFYAAIIKLADQGTGGLVCERTLVAHAQPDGTLSAPVSVAKAMDHVICCYPGQVAHRYGLTNVIGQHGGPVHCDLSYSAHGAMLVEVIGETG